MRVGLSSTEAVQSLQEALVEAHCLVRRIDSTSCRVTLVYEHDPDEALLELRFFVAAWAAGRPGLVATVSA
jgi:hypothetical protein